jgi:outer membrane protein OmpA-like peptidoglycan-associated protein
MKRILVAGLVAGMAVAAAVPAQARGFVRFGFGVPGCWGCGYGPPYYGPAWYPPYAYGPGPYGPAYPPYPAYMPPSPPYYYPREMAAPPPPPPPRDYRVTRRQGETDYELPDSVLFALDSAVVSKDADSVLSDIAQAAKDQPGARLVIEGHTDTSGDAAHNRRLSQARARAVADVLQREGVSRGRIRTEGLGETDLAVRTGDNVREPRNRRVIIRLMENGRTVHGIGRDADDGGDER